MVERAVLESIIKDILAEQAVASQPKPSLWFKLKNKLSEQGSQRGLLAVIPLVATQFNLSADDMIALLTFFLGVSGIHNFYTEG